MVSKQITFQTTNGPARATDYKGIKKVAIHMVLKNNDDDFCDEIQILA